MKKVGVIITVIILIAAIVLIGVIGYGYYQKATMEVKNPIATMEVENFGTITMELYPDQAPQSVANFIKLANNGFYDGLTFHRIIKDFMIQGGDKNGDGTGSATKSNLQEGLGDDKYSIKGEFISNKVNNTIKFDDGILAMARSDYSQYSSDLADESYNSGCSQFFIATAANTSLNGYYAAFGKVTEGLDIVHNIAAVEVTTDSQSSSSSSASSEASKPVNPPVIKSIRVETYGVDYGMPDMLTPFDYTSWLYSQYGMSSSGQ